MTGIISTTPTGSEGGASGIFGMRGLSNQYFFKSQESLATVIDTVSDNEDAEDAEETPTDTAKATEVTETEKCNSDTEEKEILGKITTV